MNYRVAVLFALTACQSKGGVTQTPLTVTLAAPESVTGRWHKIDTSTVLSCEYDVIATVIGVDGAIEWTGTRIELHAPNAMLATQEHPGTRVATWFGAAILQAGSSATAHLDIGRDRPFAAEHEFRYRLTRGDASSAKTTVHCLAP